MPRFEVRKRYRRAVRAPAPRVWEALESYDVAADSSPVTRGLLRARGLRPAAGSGRGAFAGSNFTVIAERPGTELVVALAGRFWVLREKGALDAIRDAEHFAVYDTPGRAVAAWSFEIEPRSKRECLLSTETRVRCTDAAARRKFRAYWTLIEPFSGLIRKDMLRSIARKAESAG